MTRRSIILCIGLLTAFVSFSQEQWDLRRCVEHALENNISVKQADLQARFSELSLKQSKAQQIPSLNFSGSAGYRFGRTENPTTGVLEDNNFFNTGMQLQSQVTLFNWFSQKNTIEANRFSYLADQANAKKVQDDVALNVAVAYLQVLLSRAQVDVATVQVQQTNEQLENTRKRVNAGSLPELNALELEAQLARDSSALVTAKGTVEQFLLQLKALLSIDAATPFDIVTPPVGLIPIEPLSELQPEAVYASAIANLPQQKVNELLLKSADRARAAAKGGMYPTISAFGSISTNYVNITIPEYNVGPYQPTTNIVNVGGVDYFVEAPTFVQVGERTIPLGRQFRNNFGQSVGIGLSIPIFNGRFARTAWDRAKLQYKQIELTKSQDELTLKQDIYTAYYDAVNALQKYNANLKGVEASQKAYDFAQKRYNQVMLSTLELITSQNNLQRAKFDLLSAQFDYVFKMKLLEFYKGQGLKL